MAEFLKNTLVLDHTFDEQRKRHYQNGFLSVLHCHHFTTLYSQLALDAGETDLLYDCAEETFYDMISEYFEEHGIEELEDRIDIACQYYGAVGLGKLAIDALGEYSGEATLTRSHIDEGWKKKWGKSDKPVNYITAGFIGALFSAVLDMPPGTFTAREIESIAQGAPVSRFSIGR
jgi:hypothetical protein